MDTTPDELQNNDMIVVRYEGPVGGPGMPEMLDSTSRITAICRQNNIVVGLMTDGRFSGGSVGLVIGHVGPEAAIGGAIALIENGDEIEVNLNLNQINCKELENKETLQSRLNKWKREVNPITNVHPSAGQADTRLLNRMRKSAVSAAHGAGMHPNNDLFVCDPRQVEFSNFKPVNKYKNAETYRGDS